MNLTSRLIRRLVAPLVLALLALGLMAPPASAANTAVIAGTVRAAQTGDPLPGATVSVYLTSNVGTPVQTATSAVDGTYQVGGLAAGSYKVRFSANASTFVESWYWFADTAADATAITLADGDQASWIDGYLNDATTSVAGTVFEWSDSTTLVQGVVVDMFSTGDTTHPVYSTPTEADGTYLIQGVAPGDYLVRFTADTGVRDVSWYAFAQTAAEATPVTIDDGTHLVDVNGYVQDTTMSMAGTVRFWASSLPMSGATVDLFTADNTTTPLSSTTSAADGSYTFPGLAAGSYKVRFTKTNYKQIWNSFAASAAAAPPIDLTPGLHQNGIDGYLDDATMSLAGTVRFWASSLPMSGATVDLFTADNTTTPLSSTTSAADGSYTFPGLAAGSYKVRFTKTNYKQIWNSFAASAAAAPPIDLTPGLHQNGIDGYLDDATMSLAGFVFDATQSAGVAGATVAMFSTDDTTTAIATATTGADGSYLIPISAAGNYLIRFAGPAPYYPTPQWYSFAADAGSANEIAISPGVHAGSVSGYLTPTVTWSSIGTVTVSGTTTVGSTLTATSTGWSPTPTSYNYQWYIGDTAVAGATSATWVVPAPAAQKHVHVAVRGTLAGYPAVAAIGGVDIAQAGLTPAVPTISGTARVGLTMTASTGTWAPTPDYFTYDWKVDGASAGSYASTFMVPASAVGKQISVTVTGHRDGYLDSARTSASTAAVASGNLTAPAPTITGTAAVGRTLSANPGTWLPDTTTLAYQWRAAGTAIDGATGATLQIPASVLNKTITVSITGTADGYASTTTTSAATAAVALGTLTAVTPTITGTAAVGATLTANPGAWRPYPVLMSYQWSVDGVAFPGATKQTFVVPASASGKNITVTATGNVTGYAAASRTSGAVGPVTGGTLAGPTPTITGTAQVGQSLTANPGTWGPAPVTLGYQWLANGTAISGANSGTLVVPASAVGQPITVRVTASKTGFTSVTKTSLPTAAVAAGQLVTDIPIITGSAQVGQTLTVNTGFWNPAPDSFTYQWKAAGTNISGATAGTLVIPASAEGKTITVVATGSKTGYITASRESAATATVVAATGILITAVPTISGTAAVGEVLSVSAGTWGPAPVALTYQWKAGGTNISGETSPTLLIPASTLGQPITVTVTGTKTGYTTASQTSLPTAAVAPGTLTAPTPTISGTAQVGSTLTANAGTWGPAPVALTYQWKANGSNISGATGSSFLLTAAQTGATITVLVTGTKTAYSTASRESAATAAVTNPPGTLTTAVPTVTGTAQVGATLTANAGTWGPAPVALTYQWKAGGVDISGATATTLVVPADVVGKTITVTVTGTKSGYTTASQTSVATTAVSPGTLTAPTPTISGSAVVGSSLTATAGSWGPGTVTLTYQWKAGGTNISGATGTTFVLTAAQLGLTITVVVTGTKTGYTTATKESAATAAVTGSSFTTVGTPTITGTAVVGGTLTAGTGTWAPTPDSYDYQWKAAGTAISGATATTYAIAAGDLGKTITLTVTAHKTGYADTPATSAATTAVVAGTLTAPTPTISGTAVVGSTLTANPGPWGPAPVALTYQWKAGGTTISGATGTTYLIAASDLGKTITAVVTGTKTGYTTATKESTATTAVTGPVTGTVSGTVLETDGTPAFGLDICLFHQEGDINTRQFQDAGAPAANGSYSFSAVPAGRYVLLFITSGSLLCNSGQLETAPYWPQWYRWGNAAADATFVTITPAAPTANLLTVYMTALNGGHDAELYAYAKPTITGTAAVGQILTAHAGSWFPAPTTVTRQWNADGVPISGATGTTYTATSAEAGKTITVTETASGADLHTTAATSDPTATVPGTTISGPVPTISGTAKVGSTLTVNAGSWSPSGVTLSYVWKAGSTTLGTLSSLVIPASAVGKTITVTVTGSKATYTSVSKTSAPTAVVAQGTLTGATPTITGTAKVGSTLTGHVGTWTPSPVTLTYQWKANGASISGATATTYTVSASYVGKKITLAVTGSKTGYTTLTKTSAGTATVAPGTLTAPTPTITGTAKVGSTLTAKPGSWGPAPVTMKYQWRANGAAISGATASTYKISGSYAGKKVTVTVTGSKTGYTTVAKTSAATKSVAAGTLVPQTPSISGRAKVGSTLKANPGTWTPGPVTLTYQWKANGAAISGATGKTWTVSSGAKGKRITVTVTGIKSGYTSTSRTSSRTATVVA